MARKPKRRERECEAKAGYANRKIAQAMIAEAVVQKRLREGEVLAYRCKWCTGWHIGHPSAEASGRTAVRIAKKLKRAA